MVEAVLKGGRRYWSWVGFLLILAGLGLVFYLRQLQVGLGITGMNRDVSWGLYIANFTFLVGVAASAVVVVLPYYLHRWKVFARLTVLGEFLAVAAVVMCILFIFVDLGRPDRVLNMILHPSPRSILFWDMVVLSGYLILNLLIAWNTLEAERKEVPVRGWVKPLIYISLPWAISIHTVTAFIYCGLAARPFWLTAVMAPRFLASAFASGPALLILAVMVLKRYTGFDPGEEAIQKVVRIMTYAMLASFFLLLMEIFTAFYSAMPEHTVHFHYLFAGLEGKAKLVPWIWLSVILGVGALLILLNPSLKARKGFLALACGAVFVSIWIDKGLGLIVPGFIPSPTGEVLEYWPTVPEALITVGVWAVGLLILTGLYKIALAAKGEG